MKLSFLSVEVRHQPAHFLNVTCSFKRLAGCVLFCRCGVALDVWMLPLGEEIFNYDIDQPLLFVNSQAFHRWKENVEPLKKLINKKPGKGLILCRLKPF